LRIAILKIAGRLGILLGFDPIILHKDLTFLNKIVAKDLAEYVAKGRLT